VPVRILRVSLTPDWVKDAVFYQIFPDRFAQSASVRKSSNLEPWDAKPTPHGYKGGDLLGVVERLDHLEKLGVNAIYFCPVFQSGANHRYHTHDYYNVDPMLGGNKALKKLIEAAHSRGMKVVLDGVFNHASRGFFQFHDILENGSQSAYLDWFHVKGFPLRAYESKDPPNYDAWWGYPALPKFNTATQAVREFLWEVGEFWIEQGVDGWRLDVPNEIDDDSFWQEFRARVKRANPEAYIVGEIWGDATRWLRGDQFDAVMNYPFTRLALGFCGAKTLQQSVIKETGYSDMVSVNAEQVAARAETLLTQHPWEITLAQLNLLGSHDTPRVLNVVKDVQAVKLATMLQMSFPGAPCVYYGDEVGLEGFRDPDCRRGMPWDESLWNHDLLEWTKACIRLRRTLPALQRGAYRTLHASGMTYAFERAFEDARVVTLINADTKAVSVNLEPSEYRDAMTGETLRVNGTLTLEPRTGRVLVRV
jgi:cyclomaltodextrinase / maltogenic alpha-amylase / neopullulanase